MFLHLFYAPILECPEEVEFSRLKDVIARFRCGIFANPVVHRENVSVDFEDKQRWGIFYKSMHLKPML